MNKIYLASILILNSLFLFSQQTKEIIFSDNFDTYTAGEPLYSQNPDDWYLDNSAPGPTSPLISDDAAFTIPNSVAFEHVYEVIFKPLDNLDTGIYAIESQSYIQDGKSGSFQTMSNHEFPFFYPGMEVFFKQNGIGTLQAGSWDSIYFNFEYEEWLSFKIIVDLNTDWAIFSLNDETIYEWTWTLGQVGIGCPKQLGGSVFSGFSIETVNPGYYLDNYKVTLWENNDCYDPPQNLDYYYDNDEIIMLIWDEPDCPEISHYNIYDNGELYDGTTQTSAPWVVNFGVHEICVKTIYENGESDCASVTIVITGEEEKTLDPISIFPNPSTNEVNIQSEIKTIEINVFDLYGVSYEVSKIINNSETRLNSSQLKPGIYLLQIETETGIFYKRILKK